MQPCGNDEQHCNAAARLYVYYRHYLDDLDLYAGMKAPSTQGFQACQAPQIHEPFCLDYEI